MTVRAAEDLERLGKADELEISSRRGDGTLRPFVPIWMVTVDGSLYVRSAVQRNGWYRNVLRSGKRWAALGPGVVVRILHCQGVDKDLERRIRRRPLSS